MSQLPPFCSSFFLLFVILLANLSLISLPTSAVPPPATVSDLIQRTCNSTTYFELCVSSLQSDPESSKAADVKGLSAIAVGLGISNATSTWAYASRLVSRGKVDAALGSKLRGCAGRYADAREALRSAMVALSVEDYDSACVHVSAAAGYADMCRSLFRLGPAAAYPAEMARREEALERLCTIALDIISLLG
uniref:Putative invertase inhibitor n=1 Tax=Anthurium amnicola TaxID=1678845 RepID=A0A1D1YC55_9ARAE